MVKLISFSGAIGSGKDSAASYLRSTYPNVYHIKFAHALQDQVAVLAGIYQEDLSHRTLFENREWKENYALMTFGNHIYTPRDLLKMIGEGLRVYINLNVWVEILEEKINTLPYHSVAVISDLRYPNELQWMRSRNGHSVYIKRDVAEDAFWATTKAEDLHSSESHLDYLWDYCDDHVENNDSLEQLHQSLSAIYNQYVLESN